MSRILLVIAVLLVLQAGSFGCLRVEQGIVVELSASALASGGARRVWLEDGTELTVDAGVVTITEARLLRCRDAASLLEDAARLFLGPVRAFAQHEHDASPLVLRGPFRVSLIDDVTVLGAFTPPPGRFCGMHVELGADGEAGEGVEPWTVSFRAHTADGVTMLGSSSGPGFMHVELEEPLLLDRRGTTLLRASFYEERPFARLPSLLESPEAVGTALLRGATGQGALRIEPAAGPESAD